MGNQQTKIGVRLDQSRLEAGEVVTGRVYLSLPPPQQAKAAFSGLHLRFYGEEYSQIARKRSGKEDLLEKATQVLVHNDYPLVDLRGVRPTKSNGQYEYPFQFRLPSQLPSSMLCTSGGSHASKRSFCEIRYHLEAYLSLPNGGLSRHASKIPVHVRAARQTNIRANDPVFMDPETFPVTSCCFWNKGSVSLGWQADRSTVGPGEMVKVEARGQNRSQLDVESLTAQWVETVTWQTGNGRGKQHARTSRRTIVEQRLSVDPHSSPWTARDVLRGYNNGLVQGDDILQNSQIPLRFSLRLPEDARTTYTGASVQVQHILLVRINTAGGITTTSPELASRVRVERSSSSTAPQPIFESTVPVATVVGIPTYDAVDAMPSYDMDDQQPAMMVQAQLLPPDWNPVQAPTVVIPEAAAVVMDEDTLPPSATTTYLASAPPEDLLYNHHPSVASPSVPSAAFHASAPSESLLSSTPRASSHWSEPAVASDSDRNAPLQQLRTMIVESPENLTALLADASWAGFVQGLDPRDFCALVSVASPPSAAANVARTLATTMRPAFQCRHIVACLWALPAETRMVVACAVAALPSDWDMARGAIEQELRGTELAQFQAAASRR
jgi:hypothetical protein